MMQNELANLELIVNNIQHSSAYLLVDGGSKDGSVDALSNRGITVISNPFRGFSDQRSFLQIQAKERFNVTHLLFIDADELLSSQNIFEINEAVEKNTSGLAFAFKFIYCGVELKHAYRHPVVQRLFRVDEFQGADQGAREYFVATAVSKAHYPVLHNDRKSGSLQELEKIRLNAIREAEWERNARKTNIFRKVWLKSPLVMRSFGYFLYLYIARLGFLDGRAGLKYLTLNVLIYRLLIDYELSS
ncbi:MAG: hypothetical protein CO175_08210 [Verrucomicrobia bacterium CG_4_9_14_3_um_filter_43_20]|nr:MAG: hypothetical protein CO175_08210 [Verrucomicrobia bacterium CG_4_9_14_3_um_filter_43_20]